MVGEAQTAQSRLVGTEIGGSVTFVSLVFIVVPRTTLFQARLLYSDSICSRAVPVGHNECPVHVYSTRTEKNLKRSLCALTARQRGVKSITLITGSEELSPERSKPTSTSVMLLLSGKAQSI